MKRRGFIKKEGLVSAGILASISAIGTVYDKVGANDSINIGVIRTGSRGKGMISILDGIKGINISACCDILPFRLEEGLQRASENTKAYSDYHKLLDNKSIVAILVSTPFNTHDEIAFNAIDAGKHVYCEKTMAKGINGIEKLAQKVSSSKSIFQKGYQFHSSKLYKA